jgi:cytochrome c oxidase subunit 2
MGHGGPNAAPIPSSDLVDEGRRVAVEAGCFKCHSVDGSAHIGPTWLDMYMRTETLQSGKKIVADEAYLTKSMMDPLADIVQGFPPVMPTYQGRLSAAEIGAMVEYIKSLRTPGAAAVQTKGPVYEPARTGPSVP